MSFFQRTSFTLYVTWILFESICYIACGIPNSWSNFLWFEISLAYFFCCLLYTVVLHVLVDVPYANACFNGIKIAHQWLLIAISLRNILAGSGYNRVRYGLRLLLATICTLLHLSPGGRWINDVVRRFENRKGNVQP